MNERFPNPHAHNDYQPDIDAQGYEESSREQPPRLNPRIYVTRGLPLRAELTDGTWLDMARDPATIATELYAVLGDDEAHAGAPLYIWDYQDFGAFDVRTGAIGLEGTDSIELLSQVAHGLTEHGPAYAAWAKFNEDDPRLFDHFERAYQGHYESVDGYVRHLLAPLGLDEVLKDALPDQLKHLAYIDYEAIGEQLLAQDDIVAVPAEGGGVWIFDERA
ncbi:antirestriction protein ArdA [Nocardia sp. NRRL WC-3656]|uniref:antirestriction protein ArdA n=1 Tax=Nocardia sp. NRRL WC-3656 TaxID=1463824 RepID=UPI0009DE788B|nr:antirestriction protein ArdA [Nocardia sp. NRRL WC-3656]